MSHVIYVVGVPGSGKTTLVAAALLLLDREAVVPVNPLVPHTRFGDVWHLGNPAKQGPFAGTDTLSMSIIAKAEEMLASDDMHKHCRVLLAEGDRLANNRYLNTVRACGHTLTVIHLNTPAATARQRANDRADRFNLPRQNDTWWRGRVSKTGNLVSARRTRNFDGTQHPHDLAVDLHNLITST